MVQFQHNLENARLAEWAPQYVNYSLLKLKLKDIIAVKHNEQLDSVCQARKNIFQGNLCIQEDSVHPALTYHLLRNVQHFIVIKSCAACQAYCFQSSSIIGCVLMLTAGTLDSEIEKVLSFYADISTSIRQELQDGEESFAQFQNSVMDSEELDTPQKLHRVDDKIEDLQAVAKRITDLLQYVSLNMQGIRKILKKFAKHVEPTKPSPGFLALEIQHPHEPGWKMMQVRFLSWHVFLPIFLAGHLNTASVAGTVCSKPTSL